GRGVEPPGKPRRAPAPGFPRHSRRLSVQPTHRARRRRDRLELRGWLAMSDGGERTPVMRTARLRIRRGTNAADARYDEFDVAFEDGDSVLDGLVRLRYGAAPDLAFQFSCFNANVCKECAVMIDGTVEYACIAKLKPGLTQLDPVPDQHVLRDL